MESFLKKKYGVIWSNMEKICRKYGVIWSYMLKNMDKIWSYRELSLRKKLFAGTVPANYF